MEAVQVGSSQRRWGQWHFRGLGTRIRLVRLADKHSGNA